MGGPSLRLGIFGVGRMGLVHLEHLVGLARARAIELVAIGDRYAPALASAHDQLTACGGLPLTAPLKPFATPEAMAAEAGLDAAVVASRTSDHARDSLAFASRQIPVLVEKPLANSVAEAAALCAAPGVAGGRLVQVAFQRHYDAAAQAASGWVATGRIGELQQSHHVLQDKNPTPANYQSCGITADMAIHLIFEAMTFHAFALPRTVQALRFMAPHYDDRAGEGANVVHAFCRWADGSLAHLWGSRINNTGYDNGFKLIGTKGRIDVGEFCGDFGIVSAKLWLGTGEGRPARGTLSEALEFPMAAPAATHPDFYPRYAAAYAAELAAFLDHVRLGTPFAIGAEVGWKTQLVADTAEASSCLGGREVELILPDGAAIRTAEDAATFFAAVAPR